MALATHNPTIEQDQSMPGEMMSAIFDVLRDYPIARATPRHKNHAVHDSLGQVRACARQWLVTARSEQEVESQWKLRASTGRGRAWANVCWVSVMYGPETQTAQDGRYLVWLFDAQGRHVVLALVWGTAKFRRGLKRSGEDVAEALRTRRARCAPWLSEELDEARFHIDEDADLGGHTQLARDYERSCLAWRRYETAEEIAQMREDFEVLLDAYVKMNADPEVACDAP